MALQRPMHGSGTAARFGVVALVLAAALVMLLGEHGAFSSFGPATSVSAPPIPGVTLDDSAADRTPVVTSLRSHSEAERLGVRVGDRIDAVDGRRVDDLAALRAAIARHPGAIPVWLQIHRGDAVWHVALDRAESPADGFNQMVSDEPENPSRRGR